MEMKRRTSTIHYCAEENPMHFTGTSLVGKTRRSEMRWHAGSLIRILETDAFLGEMAGVEAIVTRGHEPPRHVHAREDEAVYVLRGEVEFTIGNSQFRPAAGQWAFLPKGIPHSMRVLSPDAHLLIMYTPAGIEGFYSVLSEPAEEDQIPAGSVSYDNLFDMEYIAELGRQFGLKFYPASASAAAA